MTDEAGAFLTRRFEVEPEAVFDAWVTPASFAHWWGGPHVEIPLDSVTMDARPGGTWTATMVVGGGIPDFHFRGEYVEVDRPNRLVFTMTDEPGDERELLTVELEPTGDGTELWFSQTGGHLSADEYDAMRVGLGVAFESLRELLED